ncbi:MAG: glycosyltransferase family 2 protein [Lachnospiraceae bacterium]|nr:glycosyltransferase family 2 protein [Lachnospiraceae bacterium]
MNHPLISFIAPVYNTEKYLPECIESVLKQTNPDWELVLIDDGSSDRSGRICDEYAGKDSRIKVIHKKNGGQVETRLRGIAEATGLYCTGVDSDDYIETDCVETLAELLKKKEYDVVAWNLREIRNGKETARGHMDRYGEYTREEFLKYVSESTNHSFCNKLIKTDLLQEYRFDERHISTLYVEDYMIICPALCLANSIIAIDKVLYNYRQIDESITHVSNAFSTRRVLYELESTDCIFDIISEYSMLSAELRETECISLVRTVAYCLKRAFFYDHTDKQEARQIRSNHIYKQLRRYESTKVLSMSDIVFMKLFRFGFDKIITMIYGNRHER